MLPADVIDLAIQRTNIKIVDIGDGDAPTGTTRLYFYLNMVKDLLWNKIVGSSTGKDMSWEKWENDLQAGQSEYALPQVVSTENRLKRIETLGVSYTGETFNRTGKMIYTPARLVALGALAHDWSWYEENQSTAEPIYYVSDKSVFVAPTSPSTVLGGIQLTGIKKIPDYTDSTTEDGMVIPDDMHYLLVAGLVEQIMWKKGATANAISVKNDYKQDVRETLNVERDSHVGPKIMAFPETFPTKI